MIHARTWKVWLVFVRVHIRVCLVCNAVYRHVHSYIFIYIHVPTEQRTSSSLPLLLLPPYVFTNSQNKLHERHSLEPYKHPVASPFLSILKEKNNKKIQEHRPEIIIAAINNFPRQHFFFSPFNGKLKFFFQHI